jgi:ATP-dependent Clp protease ATP-binding subunit ClpA
MLRYEQALARLEASLRQSVSMGHNYIGTEHIVLGLLRDDSSLAAKLLAEQGVSAERVEPAVTELLSGAPTTGEPATTTATTDPTERIWPSCSGRRCPRRKLHAAPAAASRWRPT